MVLGGNSGDSGMTNSSLPNRLSSPMGFPPPMKMATCKYKIGGFLLQPSGGLRGKESEETCASS